MKSIVQHVVKSKCGPTYSSEQLANLRISSKDLSKTKKRINNKLAMRSWRAEKDNLEKEKVAKRSWRAEKDNWEKEKTQRLKNRKNEKLRDALRYQERKE